MRHKLVKDPYKPLRHLIAGPFITAMILPLVILDISLEIYHRISFAMYKIPYVRRRSYIRIDRQRLSYLSLPDKVWCMYCGYANGLLAYAVAVAGETEKYWCAIKHKVTPDFKEPEHHKEFIRYQDEESYRKKYQKNRRSNS